MQYLSSLKVLALNSVRESIRDRIYLVLVFIFIFLVAMSVLLGSLSFAEQQRIFANLSLTSVHLVILGLSIFIGSFSMSREIDKQTYMVMLVRPLSRVQFLLGKYLGIAFSMSMTLIILCVALSGLFMDFDKFSNLALIFYSLFLEGLILLALSFLLSTVLRPVVGIFSSLSIYIIGHWLDDLKFFAEKSESELFVQFSNFMNFVTPNLNRMNFKSYVFLENGIETSQIIWITIHTFAWVTLLLVLSSTLFRRKDLV